MGRGSQLNKNYSKCHPLLLFQTITCTPFSFLTVMWPQSGLSADIVMFSLFA